MSTRRHFLGTGAAMLAGSALFGSRLMAATPPSSQRKFIFIFAEGGWDTTKVFWPPYDLASGDIEPDARERQAGGITYVDHPLRPSVRTWFENYGDLCCVINGLLVRSINHWVCTRLVVTGVSTYGLPDWPSVLGAAAQSAHALPTIVLAGPSQPGELHRYSTIVGDSSQLKNLMGRTVFSNTDLPVEPPVEGVLDMVDAELEARVADRVAGTTNAGELRMLETMHDGLLRSERFAEDARRVELLGTSLTEQIQTAVSLLGNGVARCVTIAEGMWDMHSRVDEQDPLIENYFAHLGMLMELLRATPGTGGGTLADETTIVVLSEMGRTPFRNDYDGKHHWPYTSAMLVGAGVKGGTMIGGHDEFLNGLATNFQTGAPDPSGQVILPNNLGATLMKIGGVDPELWVPGSPALTAALG